LWLAACGQGRRVRFFTAANLVNRLEESQKQYQLDRFLIQLDKTGLLICDELGYPVDVLRYRRILGATKVG